MLVDGAGRLSGLFTDSDLAKLLERRADDKLDRPIAESMACHPMTIGPAALLADAIEILSRNRISELPVVDEAERPDRHHRHHRRCRHRPRRRAETVCRQRLIGPRIERRRHASKKTRCAVQADGCGPSRRVRSLSRLGTTVLTAVSLGVLFAGYCVATRSLRAQPPRPRVHEQTQQPAVLTAGDLPGADRPALP